MQDGVAVFERAGVYASEENAQNPCAKGQLKEPGCERRVR